MIIQMSQTKNNLMKLDLNPGRLILLVPDWVGCYVAYDFLYV